MLAAPPPHRNEHLSFNALAPSASHSSRLIHMSDSASRLHMTLAPFHETYSGLRLRGGGTIETWSMLKLVLSLIRWGSLDRQLCYRVQIAQLAGIVM